MEAKNERVALVLGATGGVGGATAEALLADGWAVRALVRDPAAAAVGWRGRTGAPDWHRGDAMVREDVVRLADGVQVIVHAVNPPGYRNWDKLVLPMIDNSVAAARAAGGARIVLPGTIYNFDPGETPLIDEASPQQPTSRKGAIRVALERRLEAASGEVPSLIVRAGDFFGSRAKASWFSQVMVKPGRMVRRIVDPGARGVGHSWAYLPDLAEAIVRLLDAGERLQRFERVQFEGFWDESGDAMPAAVRRATGDAAIPVRRFPWWLMRLLAPFGGFPRELMEVRPYWRWPVRLDNRRLVELLGEEPRTPIDRAVLQTLRDLGCCPAGSPMTADALARSRPEDGRTSVRAARGITG